MTDVDVGAIVALDGPSSLIADGAGREGRAIFDDEDEVGIGFEVDDDDGDDDAAESFFLTTIPLSLALRLERPLGLEEVEEEGLGRAEDDAMD